MKYFFHQSKAHRGSNIEQHIHFWLGEDASQDEVTTAAYKTVELDNMLGGAPIQHREVQGHESGRFLSYFKSGLRLICCQIFHPIWGFMAFHFLGLCRVVFPPVSIMSQTTELPNCLWSKAEGNQ